MKKWTLYYHFYVMRKQETNDKTLPPMLVAGKF